MNIYIGNLDYNVKEEDLKQTFEEFGNVSSVKIITDKFTGRSKGFGFVEMTDDAQASTAIEQLNGRAIQSREIKVTPARPKEEGENNGNRRRSGGGGNFRRGGYGNRERNHDGNSY